jgi:glycosyltransferase involved in cell wall biosynthesis
MQKMKPDLSIVMPVYNEANVIEDVVEELKHDVCSHLYRTEIVLVNDASTDDTAEILDRLANADPRLKVHHAAENGGHGPALRRAFDECSGDWIFQIDSDGQQIAAEFWELWARRGHADLVMGERAIRRNGRHRVVVSAAARTLNRKMGGGNLRDVNVPFKLVHRRVWEDIQQDIPRRPVAPSLLVAVGASVRGWHVDQVAITHLPRRHGPSTVDLKALVRLSFGALTELARFRLRLTRRGLGETLRRSRSATGPT